MDEILAKYRTPRGTHAVRLVVIHVNEGPDSEGGARSVAHYCQLDRSQRGGSVGGYHELVDDHEVIIGGHDGDIVNGASGANQDGYHICIIGAAEQTAAQWADPYSTAAWNLAAQRAQEACKRFGLPLTQLVTQQVKDGLKGICGHVNVSQAYGLSTHTDPGPNFPWTQFMAAVHPGPVPPIEEDPFDMTPTEFKQAEAAAQIDAWTNLLRSAEIQGILTKILTDSLKAAK